MWVAVKVNIVEVANLFLFIDCNKCVDRYASRVGVGARAALRVSCGRCVWCGWVTDWHAGWVGGWVGGWPGVWVGD